MATKAPLHANPASVSPSEASKTANFKRLAVPAHKAAYPWPHVDNARGVIVMPRRADGELMRPMQPYDDPKVIAASLRDAEKAVKLAPLPPTRSFAELAKDAARRIAINTKRFIRQHGPKL